MNDRSVKRPLGHLFALISILIFLGQLMSAQAQDGDFVVIHPSRISTTYKLRGEEEYEARIFLDGKSLTYAFGKQLWQANVFLFKFSRPALEGKNIKIDMKKLYRVYEITTDDEKNRTIKVKLFDEKIMEFVDEAPTDFKKATFVEDFSQMRAPADETGAVTAVDPAVLAVCKDLMTKTYPEGTIAVIQDLLAKLEAKK